MRPCEWPKSEVLPHASSLTQRVSKHSHVAIQNLNLPHATCLTSAGSAGSADMQYRAQHACVKHVACGKFELKHATCEARESRNGGAPPPNGLVIRSKSE